METMYPLLTMNRRRQIVISVRHQMMRYLMLRLHRCHYKKFYQTIAQRRKRCTDAESKLAEKDKRITRLTADSVTVCCKISSSNGALNLVA